MKVVGVKKVLEDPRAVMAINIAGTERIFRAFAAKNALAHIQHYPAAIDNNSICRTNAYTLITTIAFGVKNNRSSLKPFRKRRFLFGKRICSISLLNSSDKCF